MAKYAFLLGRKDLLSVAELTNTLCIDSSKILFLDQKSLIWEGEIKNPVKQLDQLGGTKKIIEILQEFPAKSFQIPNFFAEVLCREFAGRIDKAKFAISVEGLDQHSDRAIKNSLLECKKQLTKLGIRCRFINKNFQNPEIASLKHEKILQKGVELCLVVNSNRYFIGKTVAIQDIEAYSIRDYERPERDPKIGMLPPKLAQIMLNLSGPAASPEKTLIYDPFCGLGTILGEALLQNRRTIGSDINGETIFRCQKNLQWLSQFFNVAPNFQVFVADSRAVNKQNLPDKVSAVVSETFLGPPIYDEPPAEMLRSVLQEVEDLLVESARGLQNVIPQNCPLILCTLTYRVRKNHQDHYYPLPNLLKRMADLGYHPAELIPGEITRKFSLAKEPVTSLLYERPAQVVCRTIYKFVSSNSGQSPTKKTTEKAQKAPSNQNSKKRLKVKKG